MEYFKAITLRPLGPRDANTIIEVAAGGDGFKNRWLVLQPTDLAGQYILPTIDAGHVITVIEAAHALSFRRGRPVPVTTVRRYLSKGTISVAAHLPDGRGQGYGTWLIGRDNVWTFEWPEGGNPNWIRACRERQAAQQEADENE